MPLTFNGSGTITGLTAGGLPDGSIQAADLASGVGGIGEVDTWKLTADAANDLNPISSNLARVTSYWTKKGTGMSESSGVFTFPSTGYWLIQFLADYYTSVKVNEYISIIQVTSDNSSYSDQGYTRACNDDHSGEIINGCNCHYIFRVADTSTHKCRFRVEIPGSPGTVTTYGGGGGNYTSMNFIKLAGL